MLWEYVNNTESIKDLKRKAGLNYLLYLLPKVPEKTISAVLSACRAKFEITETFFPALTPSIVYTLTPRLTQADQFL